MLKTAIVGAGFMGPTHIEALRRLNIPVLGMLGADPQETRTMTQKLGIPRAYQSLEDLLADPEINVVHLCTPNYLHFPQAKMALLAGKHVLCEKPLATTRSEAEELVRIASEQGRAAAVNYNLRFYPLCQEAHARIAAGEAGEPRLIHGGYCQDWLFLPSDWNWRLEPELGGDMRAVGDIGTHWMDMVTWLTGLKITAVMADFATIHPTRYKPTHAVDTFASKLSEGTPEGEPVAIHTEDYAGILLRFSNGAHGTLTLSQVSAGRKNHFWWEINGAKESLAWDQETANELWVGRRERPNESVIKDPSLMQPSVRKFAAYPGGHAEGYPDTFVQLFKSFYTYIEAGSLDTQAPAPFPTFADGLQEMILCEAILQSAHSGSWVELE